MNGFDQGGQAIDRPRNKQQALREVRNLAQDALAIILAGGRGSRLAELTELARQAGAAFRR
jgi:ribosomal protein L10